MLNYLVVAGITTAAIAVVAITTYALCNLGSCCTSRLGDSWPRGCHESRLKSRTSQSYGSIVVAPQPPVSQLNGQQYVQVIDDQGDSTSMIKSLRAEANKEDKLIAWCEQQSRKAYRRRDPIRAKALIEQADRHVHNRDLFDAQANAMIFNKNNQNQPVGQVDLHGLYVKEAITYAEDAVAEALRRGEPELRLIVGKGIHSYEGLARIRPAVRKHLQKRGFNVYVDPNNWGVLVVELDEVVMIV